MRRTGAPWTINATGIGFATAKRFVKEGAHVFITGRRELETAAAVKEIGRNVTGVQGDVSNLDDDPGILGARSAARAALRSAPGTY